MVEYRLEKPIDDLSDSLDEEHKESYSTPKNEKTIRKSKKKDKGLKSPLWWSKNMLTNIVRMFSPMQILRLRLVQTNTRLRAAVFEVLPRLWKRHQVRLDKTRLNLQNIDAEYMASNAILFSRMEQWVI